MFVHLLWNHRVMFVFLVCPSTLKLPSSGTAPDQWDPHTRTRRRVTRYQGSCGLLEKRTYGLHEEVRQQTMPNPHMTCAAHDRWQGFYVFVHQAGLHVSTGSGSGPPEPSHVGEPMPVAVGNGRSPQVGWLGRTVGSTKCKVRAL